MSDKKEEVKESKYVLVEVPTQHVLAIQTPEGEVLNVEQAIIHILNELKDIKKNF